MSDRCKHHRMACCEPCAYDRGLRDGQAASESAHRQAQYELQRAVHCWWGGCHPRSEDDCVHENTPGACPTDYRECPLTKDGEK
jgi:hypothetical protein